MRPAYGAANATRCLPGPLPFVNTVMNRLSPVSSRLPAPRSAPMIPGLPCWVPSPKTVSIWMPGRHVHHRARFGHRTFAGIQLHFDELHVFADDLEVDVVSAPPGRAAERWRRGRRGVERRGKLRHRAERRPVRHPCGEHQGVGVDAAIGQVRPDLILAHGAHLVPANCHVPLACHHDAPIRDIENIRLQAPGGRLQPDRRRARPARSL